MNRVFFDWLNLRRWLLRPGRTLLTVLGIALGVSMAVAVSEANTAILASYRAALEPLVGRTALEAAGPASAGFATRYLASIRRVPGVEAAVPVVEGNALVTSGSRAAATQIFAVAWPDDRVVRDYFLHAGAFPRQGSAGWVMVGTQLAQAVQIRVGQQVAIRGSSGAARVTVAGILSDRGIGLGDQGMIVVTSLGLGQRLFGVTGRVDHVDVEVVAGASVSRVLSSIRKIVPNSVSVHRPNGETAVVRESLQGLQFLTWFATVLAFFAAAVIVYANMAVGVKERRRDLAVLRALGLRRRSAGAVVLVEACALGLTGSVLGAVLGAGMAKVVAAGFATSALAGLGSLGNGFSLAPGDLLIAIVLGTIGTVLAALLPAREATATDPIADLQGAPEPARVSVHRTGWAWVVLLAGCFGTVWLLHAGAQLTQSAFLYCAGASLFATGVGVVGLGPAWVRWGALPVRKLLGTLGLAGRIAAENILRAPGRAAISIFAFFAGIAFFVGFSAFSGSYTSFVGHWVDSTIRWNLRVSDGLQGENAKAPLQPAFAQQLKGIPGVTLVSPQRFAFVPYQNKVVQLSVFNMRQFPQYASLDVASGVPMPRLAREMADGQGVAVTSVAAALYHVKSGSRIELPTAHGLRPFRVLAVISAFSPDTGEIYIDRSLYERNWLDTGVDAYVLRTAPGTERRVAAQVAKLHPGGAQLVVQDSAQFKSGILYLINQGLSQVQGLVGVSILVGCLSIINILAISVMERRREIAILRSVGGERGFVLRSIVAEGAGIGAYGAVLGGGLGVLLSYVLIGFTRIFNGLALRSPFPAGWLAAGVLTALILAPLASLLPARQAARLHPAVNLRYE